MINKKIAEYFIPIKVTSIVKSHSAVKNNPIASINRK